MQGATGICHAALEEKVVATVAGKEKTFRALLVHPQIKAVRSFGLWMAVAFDSFDTCKRVIDACIEAGIITDWFLFAPHCLRISPPLTISKEEIKRACLVILESIG